MSARLVHQRRRAPAAGYSLIELMAVMAIIAIVSTLSLSMISHTLQSFQLDSAGQLIVNQLNLARQTALSRGHAVQVRFYLLPDYSDDPAGARKVFRAMQPFIESDPVQSGGTVKVTAAALVKPIFFPAAVVISTGGSPVVSPLLPATPGAATSADPTYSLPIYGANYQYASFHFKPDGSTDLTPATNSFTLVQEQDKIVANGLPSNFQTIAIEPLSGTVRSFRP